VCHTEGKASAQTRRMEDSMGHWLTGRRVPMACSAESQMAMWRGEGSRISQVQIMKLPVPYQHRGWHRIRLFTFLISFYLLSNIILDGGLRLSNFPGPTN